ncbi:type I 3-dehydroquinate dehydratase [Pantoea sp. CCBC3-3-1]|uniref:type I 3-dehydroquinate dehydratase n=1 Tax=Pantoea sp. CCBC3-3-1 TaxID=2490851 RepID=UPI0011BE543F|nr:type I 3-dehydroquinate dehydratase [Pantoea sp. CCBC3-3-1]
MLEVFTSKTGVEIAMHRRDFIGSGSAIIALSLMSSSGSAADAPQIKSPPLTLQKPVLKLKGIAIGEGEPKIIIPTTATTESEVLHFVDSVAARTDFHMLELRLDSLENGTDGQAMAALSHKIAKRLPGKLLLLTFRTKAEGGKKAVSDRQYAQLYQVLLQQGEFDLLDIEMYRDRLLTEPLIDLVHQRGRHVILSSHELHATPSAEEIVSRLREQQMRGADILKLAAMPADASDVLRLLSATLEMHQRFAQRPLLTMAMGDTGVLTRMSGELSGSALTFASLGDASASGQVALDDLSKVLNVIHKGMSS